MQSDESDEQLLERYAQGDAQAFEEFFLRHRSRVYFYALKKVQRAEVAVEIVQSVFLKLHAKIHLYRAGERALPWFFTIVHNTCLDELRNMTVVAKIKDAAQKHNEQNDALSVHAKSESTIEEQQRLQDVSQSLNQLTAEQRRVVELRIMGGKTFRQIAEETGGNEVALRKVYSRAVETLRRWFSSTGSKEDGQ